MCLEFANSQRFRRRCDKPSISNFRFRPCLSHLELEELHPAWRGRSRQIKLSGGDRPSRLHVIAHFSRIRADFAHLTPLKNFAMLTSFRAFAPKTAEFRAYYPPMVRDVVFVDRTRRRTCSFPSFL